MSKVCDNTPPVALLVPNCIHSLPSLAPAPKLSGERLTRFVSVPGVQLVRPLSKLPLAKTAAWQSDAEASPVRVRMSDFFMIYVVCVILR